MHRRRKLLVLPLAGIAAASLAGATAFGAAGAPKVDHIAIKSGLTIKPGHWLRDNLRYSPVTTSVKSGGTVVLRPDKGAFDEGPHSFSLVKKKDLPTKAKQINNCAVCGKIAQEHGVDPSNPNSQPTTLFVDGGDGFNKPYDSVVFDPGHPASGADAIHVTAKKGTTLYYMCALHPWMQGKIRVK